MPYTKAQHGLIGAALGAKKSGKKEPSYVPQSMSKLPKGKLSEMASSPTRKKVGKGHWGSEMKSAGGSCTVVEKSEMIQGNIPPVMITNHRGEVIGKVGEAGDSCCEKGGCGKMGNTQKVMTIGA